MSETSKKSRPTQPSAVARSRPAAPSVATPASKQAYQARVGPILRGSPAGGAGSLLPADVRNKMESAFRADFSDVTVEESEQARDLGAQAFTRGDHIVFAPGSLQLHRPGGQRLLGHELAHVLQQRHGRVAPRTHAGGVAMDDDARLEREADDLGRRAAAGHSAIVPEHGGLAVHAGAARIAGARLIQRHPGPLEDAVRVVKASAAAPGSTYLTEDLVRGIREAEAEFLRMHPFDRWAEAVGAAGTVGPGQLGESAISSVDSNFATAAAAFAAIHGAAPSGWEARATDSNWSYFYIAAYLVFSINEAARVFQPATPTLSNQQLGVLELGLALYHGGFATIRDMRRRIAGARGITPGEVTYAMVEQELRSGSARPQERDLERYVMLARGYFDLNFDITAAVDSRRFDISTGGKLRVTLLASYQNSTPVSANRGSTYLVTLHKYEVAGGPGGAVGEGTNPVSTFRFQVGVRGTAEWTELRPGDYMLRIRKEEETYSADHLIGQGRAETMY